MSYARFYCIFSDYSFLIILPYVTDLQGVAGSTFTVKQLGMICTHFLALFNVFYLDVISSLSRHKFNGGKAKLQRESNLGNDLADVDISS